MALFESLESRVLFTSTPAQIAAEVHAIKADSLRVQKDVTALTTKLAKDQKVINADLTHLGVSTTQASLAQNLLSAGGAFTGDLSATIKVYRPELNKEVATLVSEEKQYAKKPGTNLLQELRADYAVLGSISIGGNAPFTYYSKAPPVYAAMDAIKAANPSSSKVSSDIKNLETGLRASVTKTTNDAGKLFDADIGYMEGLWPYPA
jgi:hypothetical protein